MARIDRINLSTRPFYNERAVHASLALAAALVLAVSAFNLWQVYVLSGRHAELQGRIAQAETKIARAAGIRPRRSARSINPRELEATVAAAREANAPHRAPRVLVDRGPEPVRDDAARRRAHLVGAAAGRARRHA